MVNYFFLNPKWIWHRPEEPVLDFFAVKITQHRLFTAVRRKALLSLQI